MGRLGPAETRWVVWVVGLAHVGGAEIRWGHWSEVAVKKSDRETKCGIRSGRACAHGGALCTHDASKCEQKHSGEGDSWADGLSEHQIMGWRAVAAEGLQCKGSHKRIYCFRTDRYYTTRLALRNRVVLARVR